MSNNASGANTAALGLRRRWLTTDVCLGLGVIVLAAIVLALTWAIDEAPAALAQNVQPSTFPRLVCLLLAGLGIGLVATGLRQSMEPKSLPALAVFTTGAAMLLFPPATGLLGMPLAMVVFCVALPWLWGTKITLYRLLFAVAFPAAIYVLFAKILGVYLAPGIFGF